MALRMNIAPAQREVALLVLALTSCARAAKAPSELVGNFRVHDPSLIKQGETYYVFSTGDERGLNQGAIQIRRSADLAQWDLVRRVFAAIYRLVHHYYDKRENGTPKLQIHGLAWTSDGWPALAEP